MIGKTSAALALVLVIGFGGIASARPMSHASAVGHFTPVVERYYDGVAYPHDEKRFCYLPSDGCDDDQSETN